MKLFTIAAALLLSSIHSSEAAVPKLRANLKNGASTSTADAEVEMVESKSAATEVAYDIFGPGHCQDANKNYYGNFGFYGGSETITLSECKRKCGCALGVAGVELRGFFFRTYATTGKSLCSCFVDPLTYQFDHLKKECGYGLDSAFLGVFTGEGGIGEIKYSDGDGDPGDGTCYRKK